MFVLVRRSGLVRVRKLEFLRHPNQNEQKLDIGHEKEHQHELGIEHEEENEHG
jgi:hypothetical protein